MQRSRPESTPEPCGVLNHHKTAIYCKNAILVGVEDSSVDEPIFTLTAYGSHYSPRDSPAN